jgi:hypothetical protein
MNSEMRWTKIHIFTAVILTGISFNGCKTSFEEIKYYNGNADFTRYVAIGGSFTAGYADKALHYESQLNSFPAMLAERFEFTEGGPFKQPLVNQGVGIGFAGNAKYTLQLVNDLCGTGMVLQALPAAATGDNTNFTWIGNQGPFNNLGVPRARTTDLNKQSFGDPSPFVGNPFYARFASAPSTSTVTGDALLASPTFFTVWMGLHDVYDYALTGGREGGDSITTVQVFGAAYATLISDLKSTGAQGVVANIPSPSSFPFFTAIPYNGLELNEQQAIDLNNAYSIINPNITFSVGLNPFIIADTSDPSGRRQIHQGEFLLLSIPQDSLRCAEWGSLKPIPARYVLDAAEVSMVESTISGYNTTILSVVGAEELAHTDMNAYYKTLESGFAFSGVNYSTSYLMGEAFSTDGFHPSQRGAALIANRFLETINNFFASKIPLIDANSKPGINFP